VGLLVLFDLDGTLFLTPDALYGVALIDSVRDVFGHELSRETLERSDNAGETASSGLRRLLQADGTGRFDAGELGDAEVVVDGLTSLPAALEQLER
jgi:phosphoglycolate phosphatase-like HAD superfamily hydrolase